MLHGPVQAGSSSSGACPRSACLAISMNLERPTETAGETVLSIYLLGTVDFQTVRALQKRLVYETAGLRHSAALILCEHPPLITVGRHGQPADIRIDPEDLEARHWPMRWVNRGGGCWLHLPGQLAIYPILPLDLFHLGLEGYLDRLQQVLINLLDDFGVLGQRRDGQVGIWVGPRPLACVGIAVWDWVSYHGCVFNLNPDLVPYRWVQCGGKEDGPMTSLVKERRAPLRPGLVRERLIEHFQMAFPFDRNALFFGHPMLKLGTSTEAVLAWA
jgi:lipoyl(octanoyl) transferase